MKSIHLVLATALLVTTAMPGWAQDTTDKPISAIPPSGLGHNNSVITNTTPKSPSSMNPSASKEGDTHNTGLVANGPTPPRQTGTQPSTTASAGKAPAGAPSSTVKPGPAYNAGSANVGNSSEAKGMLGSQGASASATMQNGHTSDR